MLESMLLHLEEKVCQIVSFIFTHLPISRRCQKIPFESISVFANIIDVLGKYKKLSRIAVQYKWSFLITKKCAVLIYKIMQVSNEGKKRMN